MVESYFLNLSAMILSGVQSDFLRSPLEPYFFF